MGVAMCVCVCVVFFAELPDMLSHEFGVSRPPGFLWPISGTAVLIVAWIFIFEHFSEISNLCGILNVAIPYVSFEAIATKCLLF